ncbi:MAG: ester cyclase [Erythrobacter sp.]|nr:ester cyclase [Erythrobacter sp.]
MTALTSPLPITEVATTSEAELLNPIPGRRMELPGFDEEFVDFPDYIVRITDRIWHKRQIEKCLDYYTQDCAIHTLAGDIVGADTVVANTRATLESFPDRRLEPDNVVWSDDGEAGFYSSHLITSPMTNLGPSDFGPATGKRVKVITIADCACRDNRIYEEWLARDYSGMAIQMGRDPAAIGQRQASEDAARGFSLIAHHADRYQATAANAVANCAMPLDPSADPTALALFVLGQVWLGGNEEAASQAYDFRVKATYPSLKLLYGSRELLAHTRALFGCFDEASIAIEHLADIAYLSGAGRDVAVRWSFAGKHARAGAYGEPTGKPIVIMGITHWRIINGQIAQEITIWDDVAVHRQIATAA